MGRLVAIVWLGLGLAVAACGGSSGGDGDGDGDGDGVPGADGDGGGDGGGGGDAAPPLPVCVATCTQASDCASGPPGTTIDADNYACEGGRCRYLGCRSTQECTTTYNDPDYTCATGSGVDIPTCWPTCTVAADCAIAGSPLYGADNYACDGGKCRWTGCNATSECTQTNQSPNWICAARGGSTLATCWKTCTAPADCAVASAPYDADNYACDDGACVWRGCNTTAECMTIDPDYVCQ